jgi:hypothetical protein
VDLAAAFGEEFIHNKHDFYSQIRVWQIAHVSE